MAEIFIVSKGIFDDEELDIYEKMAFIVISGYIETEENLDEQFLAQKMGCGIISVKKAIKGLREKGILELIDDEESEFDQVFINRRKVIRSNNDINTESIDFESYFEKFPSDEVIDRAIENDNPIFTSEKSEVVEEKADIHIPGIKRSAMKAYGKTNKKAKIVEKKKSIPEERYVDPYRLKIDLVKKIINEPLSDAQLMIIFNIAGGDIELIKEKYKVASYSQINDTIGVLMSELQKESDKKSDKRLNNQINYEAIEYIKKQNGGNDDGEY